MIAFPVLTEKENANVSPLFGKAKYFAFYDGENLSVEKNEQKGGIAVVDWFKQKGVSKVVIKEMGSHPYLKIQEYGMELYYAGDSKISTNELLEKIDENSLEKLSEEKINEIIKKHEKGHNKHHHH